MQAQPEEIFLASKCATWRNSCSNGFMDQHDVQTHLLGLPNLSKFAETYGLPLRTLERLKVGDKQATLGTLALVVPALRSYYYEANHA